MKQFQSVSVLVSYQGYDSVKRLRKFIKMIERNMNNSINLDSNIDITRKSKGYVIRLLSINGIKKVFPNGAPDENLQYSIRYFINMFNYFIFQPILRGVSLCQKYHCVFTPLFY